MNQRKTYIYIPCQGLGRHCVEMTKELKSGIRFKLNPDKTVLRIIDNEIINCCPFCGRYINR